MMERKLLKIAAVWLLVVFMIDGCFSTLSKSDRGKKKKKEAEVKFLCFQTLNEFTVNPYLTNGISNSCCLDESTFIFREVGSNLNFYFTFR